MDASRINLTLRPHESLALRAVAEATGLTQPEVLRVGLRLLWRLWRQGKFRPKPRLLWDGRSIHRTRRRKP